MRNPKASATRHARISGCVFLDLARGMRWLLSSGDSVSRLAGSLMAGSMGTSTCLELVLGSRQLAWR